MSEGGIVFDLVSSNLNEILIITTAFATQKKSDLCQNIHIFTTSVTKKKKLV